MQHDEVIWQVVRHNHCSFMAKIETGRFCRNLFNLTGVCNRSSCPLANSRYATILNHDGIFYLYLKTPERAHMPNQLWEKIKLPKNYLNAIKIIDKHMMYWPKYLVHKAKQRLTKMTLVRIRSKNNALRIREKIMTTPRKETKRDARRLEKAEKAAQVEKKICEELLERYKSGVYNGIYNFNQMEWNEILKDNENEDVEEVEYVEGYAELEEDDMEDFGIFAKDDSFVHRNIEPHQAKYGTGVGVSTDSRKESRFLSRLIENDIPVFKSKKKTKVLVEFECKDDINRQVTM